MDVPAAADDDPPRTPRLSVVIPARNEAHRLPGNLARVADYLREKFPGPAPVVYEVLVVVERGTDDTLARCRDAAAGLAGFGVIDNGPHRGKGYAVRSGLRRACGAVRLFMDADLATPLEEIGRFMDEFAARPEVDVLIGDRRQAGGHLARRQGPWRRSLGGAFGRLARHRAGNLLPPGVADTQCGFKAFRAAAAEAIFSRQRLDGFSFDVEVLMLAAGLGLRVGVLPVPGWTDAPASTLRVLRDGWAMLRDLQRVRGLVKNNLRG